MSDKNFDFNSLSETSVFHMQQKSAFTTCEKPLLHPTTIDQACKHLYKLYLDTFKG